VSLQGGIPKNLQSARGDLKKKIYRGIPKPTYFAGGINYLTLFIIMFAIIVGKKIIFVIKK
jgi:hypothetical protein